MTNPTSNFGWQMPTSTDLVTDLPADFEVFGQAVDTSLAELKGGTTGQILSKTSNTDMDFTWVAPTTGDITEVTAGTGISGGGTSGAVTITNSMATAIDAKGDLVVGTGADTFSRLAVGANNTVLMADSAQATGTKWGTVAGSPTGWTLLNAGGTTLSGAATVTVSSISAKQLCVLVKDAVSTTSADIRIRPNTNTGGNYQNYGITNSIGASYAVGNFAPRSSTDTAISLGVTSTSGSTVVSGYCFIDCADQTGTKFYEGAGSGSAGSGSSFTQRTFGGILSLGAAITSISINTDSGSFSSGTVFVYGAN